MPMQVPTFPCPIVRMAPANSHRWKPRHQPPERRRSVSPRSIPKVPFGDTRDHQRPPGNRGVTVCIEYFKADVPSRRHQSILPIKVDDQLRATGRTGPHCLDRKTSSEARGRTRRRSGQLGLSPEPVAQVRVLPGRQKNSPSLPVGTARGHSPGVLVMACPAISWVSSSSMMRRRSATHVR
jgi:hypothetical protein